MATTTPTPAPRTRTGCTSCRVRHLKCDETKPVCRRCQRAGRECVRGYNVRFRYGTDLGDDSPAGGRAAGGRQGEFRFGQDQVWLRTSGDVSFVDETNEVTRCYDEIGSPGDGQQRVVPSPAPSNGNRSVSIHNLITSPVSVNVGYMDGRRESAFSAETLPKMDDYGHDVGAGGGGAHAESRGIPLEHILVRPGRTASRGGMGEMVRSSLDDSTPQYSDERGGNVPGLHLERSIWPLKDPRDAKLMQHYISHMGKWFDMHDRLNHFQTVVPLASATCPMLMDAMLALAARHLSHTADYDPYIANHYHTSCLKSYIPALGSTGSTLDSSLLAATVILRTFEELDVSQVGQDDEHYLLGSSIFGSLHPSIAISGGLRQACFWVYLRQDIYISFVKQRPVKTNLENLQLDRSLSPADDCTWANRITFKCAEILDFAFAPSPRSPTSISRADAWKRHCDEVAAWENMRPDGFQPVYIHPRDATRGKWFPEMWFALDCHATGMQYLHLCKILLTIYDPSLPRMGPGLKAAMKKVSEEVVDKVRTICGIAVGNRPVPAWFTACHAVYVCGEWFDDESERMALLGVMEDTERKMGWPTLAARRALRGQWGMGDEPVTRGESSSW